MAASCTDYRSQIDLLQQEIDQISDNLELIESVADNLGALRDVLDILEAGDFIISAAPAADGYDFEFKTNGKLNVGSRTAGVSVGFADGAYFWTLDGQPIKDASGARLPIAVSPIFHARESGIELSADGGKSWVAASGSADSVITSVQEDATKISITFLGGTVVDFPKEKALSVSLSGDGATMASDGTASVDFLILGEGDSYSVTAIVPRLWRYDIKWENSCKGTIEFVAPEASSETVRLYFGDGKGHILATDVDFSLLTVDESFPVMYPAWEAYSIASGGGSVEVELGTNLDYEISLVGDGGQWLSLPDTKAVRTDRLVFSASANLSGEMRSATVVFASGTYARTIIIYQACQAQLPGQNLSAGGTANCYIVPAAGDYYFDATVMGCGPGGIMPEGGFHTADARLNPAGVEIMMEFGDEPLIENLRLEDGKVHFHATGAKGNVIVAVSDVEWSIIWSWHIWCTDMPVDKYYTNGYGGQVVLLDRNIGATGCEPEDGMATYGFYYQWGRKDPFVVDSFLLMRNNFYETIEYGIGFLDRPLRGGDYNVPDWLGSYNNYLWGNPDYRKVHNPNELVKTIYDPCPAGYMVPPAHVFAFLREKSRVSYVENGLVVRGDYGQRSFFPFSGSVYSGSEYDAYGGTSNDPCLVLWNSCAARYHMSDNDGASVIRVSKNSENVEFNKAEFRARGIPVRCIKQQ